MKTVKYLALATASVVVLSFYASAVMAQSDTMEARPAVSGKATTQAQPDADMQGVLDALTSLKPKPLETLDAKEARKQPTPADGVVKYLKEKGSDPANLKKNLNVKTDNITYTGAAGDQKARIYRPESAGDQVLPVVLYIHGGGFVIADIDVYDATPRSLANKTNAMVVSIEYRHAPEDKFPAAHDDAFAAYQWLLAHAADYKGDPGRIAVVGESAGGNLAANVAIMARNANVQAPVYLGLIYPMAGTDLNTPSYTENAGAKPLNKPMMEWFYKNLTRNQADMQDKRLDLVHADLKGLPETTIVTAQIDPLRSDGERLAAAMKKAGDTVELVNFDGVTHEFFGMDAAVAKAEKAQDMIADQIAKAFKSAK